MTGEQLGRQMAGDETKLELFTRAAMRGLSPRFEEACSDPPIFENAEYIADAAVRIAKATLDALAKEMSK